MLSQVKESIRIKHDKLDSDLQGHIDACKADLKRAGVNKIDETDALIMQAIKIYVKWQVNYEGQADRFMRAYESLRDALSLCGDYNV